MIIPKRTAYSLNNLNNSFFEKESNRMKPKHILASQEGSALIIAVLVLCILTILGIASNNSSTIDLQIAANDRDYVQEFYVADSGWKSAVYWLDDKTAPPNRVNTASANTTDFPDASDAVRNFGGGGADDTNDTYPDGEKDGAIDGVNYWYNVIYEDDEVELGSGKNYRKFTYTSRSVANKSQEIEVRLAKVFKVGY